MYAEVIEYTVLNNRRIGSIQVGFCADVRDNLTTQQHEQLVSQLEAIKTLLESVLQPKPVVVVTAQTENAVEATTSPEAVATPQDAGEAQPSPEDGIPQDAA